MSDSAATPNIRPSVLIEASRGGADRPNLLIIRLPQNLERVEKPIAIEGKIVESKPDGTLRILTENGEIIARAEKPLNLNPGESVEIRLPRGEPPETATVRPSAPERPSPQPQTPETNAPVKLPPQITPRELAETIEKIVLKSLPPAQIAKIIIPYIETIKAELPAALLPPQPLPLPELPPAQNAAATTQIQTPVVPPITIDILPPQPETPRQPILQGPLKPAAASILLPKTIADILARDEILITPSQGLLSFLKRDNPADLLKAKLIPLPLDIPPRAILPQLITNPLGLPITIPKLETPQAISQPPIFTAEMNFEILAITPPTAKVLPATETSPAAPTTEQPPQPLIGTIQAIVTGYTPEQNFPILQIVTPPSRVGEFYTLEYPVRDIPLGTQIDLRPIPPGAETPPIPLSAPAQSALPLAPITLPATPQQWTTIQEIQNILTQISPPTAQAFNAVLPQAVNPPQLGPAVLFFLAALRSGDLSGWLGDKAIDALKKAGKSELLTRLGGEMSTLSRSATEPLSQDWRMTTVPLTHNNDIQKLVIYYKNDGRDQNPDEQKNGGGTRFLMNLNLSKIGPLQLDGLFRADQKRLDLMLRTNTAFSAPMQTEMQQLYRESLSEISYTGELGFQNRPEQWVHVTPDQRTVFSQKI